MNPMQREFIRLAQIFKAQLVAEMELKQRVLERGLIEDRSNNENERAEIMREVHTRAIEISRDAHLALLETHQKIQLADVAAKEAFTNLAKLQDLSIRVRNNALNYTKSRRNSEMNTAGEKNFVYQEIMIDELVHRKRSEFRFDQAKRLRQAANRTQNSKRAVALSTEEFLTEGLSIPTTNFRLVMTLARLQLLLMKSPKL